MVEVFGRYSGETSLVSAYLSGVERAVISEVPFDVEKLATKLLQDKRANPSGYAMMTISEARRWSAARPCTRAWRRCLRASEARGVGQVTGEALREITGEGIIYQQVGYLMRSGSPDSLDLMVAINYAVMADLVIERQFGRLVALRNGTTNVPPSSSARASSAWTSGRSTTSRPTVPRSATSTASRCSVLTPESAREWDLEQTLSAVLAHRDRWRRRPRCPRTSAPRSRRTTLPGDELQLGEAPSLRSRCRFAETTASSKSSVGCRDGRSRWPTRCRPLRRHSDQEMALVGQIPSRDRGRRPGRRLVEAVRLVAGRYVTVTRHARV